MRQVDSLLCIRILNFEIGDEMKTKFLAVAIGLVAMSAGFANAADPVKAQALATWTATAKKDVKSKLVVTPIGSLTFQYAEGIKGFNTQKGLFDVTVEGDTNATDFKLTSRLVSSTLKQLDSSGSTLTVWVEYNGEPVLKNQDTTLIDTAGGKSLGGNLNAIANGYNKSGRTSAQDAFTFSIGAGTTDGNTMAKSYSELPDGIWSGDVSVQFDATWTSV